MNWEVAACLVFILALGMFYGTPFSESLPINYTVDENGVKHYILVPEGYYQNTFFDKVTNILFNRYDVYSWTTASDLSFDIINNNASDSLQTTLHGSSLFLASVMAAMITSYVLVRKLTARKYGFQDNLKLWLNPLLSNPLHVHVPRKPNLKKPLNFSLLFVLILTSAFLFPLYPSLSYSSMNFDNDFVDNYNLNTLAKHFENNHDVPAITIPDTQSYSAIGGTGHDPITPPADAPSIPDDATVSGMFAITESVTPSSVLGFPFGLSKFFAIPNVDDMKTNDIERLKIELHDAKSRLEQLKLESAKLKTYDDFDKQHVLEKEYAWGLVSLNTQKSTYKPGDTADLIVVVLDSEGHPECNADITINITDPQNNITILTSINN